MTRCSPKSVNAAHDGPSRDEILLASASVGKGLRQTDLSVPGIHCGGCIQRIERALDALDGVVDARVNLSTRRVAIRWTDDDGAPPPFVDTLCALGYSPHLHAAQAEEKDETLAQLIRAMAVAGFAAGNIMLFSVSVWSGAEPAVRDLFHWISAVIALPALVYSGRIFFGSAWGALKHGRTNMDVPISIGVLLAFGLSLHDTIQGGRHAYFDAAVMLLFFLLIGRTLDHMMRERARVAVKGLAQLAARGAMVLHDDGTRTYLPVADIRPGMSILLAAGERVPVDARVEAGASDLDCSLVTGESMPQPVAAGSELRAGTLNLTGPLTVTATSTADRSFLAEMVRLMEAAESGRSGYRRIADRAARAYAPVVHTAALATFIGWMIAVGDLHQAVTVAIAVLIITCPCALGLAVPMVQVVASRRLFDNGIMVKDGSAMERLSEIDTVVFDKTGTLTLGRLNLSNAAAVAPARLALAAAIAAHSRHPHSRALVAADTAGALPVPVFDAVNEYPGLGLEAIAGPDRFRLGRAAWALEGAADRREPETATETVLSRNGRHLETFRFSDGERPNAAEAINALRSRGLAVEVLSGDRSDPVRRLACELDLDRFEAEVQPADKAARIAALADAGHKVLMVGDGLNDAPALVAAHVSMAPATAADVGRNAADFVFLRDSLAAVPHAFALSRAAGRLIRQNLALATIYNAVALPIAVLGHVTPLIAAVAMSLSSIIVVGNALRLNGDAEARKPVRSHIPAIGQASPLGGAAYRSGA